MTLKPLGEVLKSSARFFIHTWKPLGEVLKSSARFFIHNIFVCFKE